MSQPAVPGLLASVEFEQFSPQAGIKNETKNAKESWVRDINDSSTERRNELCIFLSHGNLFREFPEAAILLSWIKVSYCTSGCFSS